MWFYDEMPLWVTREYLSTCKERDNAKTKSVKHPTVENKAIAKHLRNKAHSFARGLKRSYFYYVFQEAEAKTLETS